MSAQIQSTDARHIEIGLVNNMPDAALDATERQFRTLIESAAAQCSPAVSVNLSLYALPGVPPPVEGKRNLRRYASTDTLGDRQLDGLIVTGTEPVAARLHDEPYWPALTRLLNWAECNTHSAVWSCLAAHAAVLHIDGIERRSLGDKLFGVFEGTNACGHPLMAGVAPRFLMPHSRWNGLPNDRLAACGYVPLSQSSEAGISAFVKQRNSLFLFFQGHPEYDADSLLLEYRRDVRRFLTGERATHPSLPRGYFDQESTALLVALRERALADRREEVLDGFPAAAIAAKLSNTWRAPAAAVYRNWLQYLSGEKARTRSHPVMASASSTSLGPLLDNGALAIRPDAQVE